MITYRILSSSETSPHHIQVWLDGKIVGKIRNVLNGWRYYPKGSHDSGQTFPTLADVKRSLEEE